MTAASSRTLDGHVAVVTGAGRGIGRAIALRLASAGAAVGVLDLAGAAAEQVAAEIGAAGGTAAAVAADVTDRAAVGAAMATVRRRLGPVAVLVNNAGWDRLEPFLENDPALWDRLVAVNFMGALHCTRAAADDLIAAHGGRIVFISSDAGRVGSMGEAVYAGCKAGLIGFAKTMARELARHAVTVNVVCPGPTETALLAEVTGTERGAKVIDGIRRAIPLGRLGRPEDVAAAVAFFVSPEAGYVTGQVLSVSGGLTMVG
jgi:2-hydroxycyclohexanecarboxyl-CoA dehydrogenase